MTARTLGSVAVGAVLVAGVAVALSPGWIHAAKLHIQGRATVADRVAQFGDRARARLAPHFERAGVAYPPEGFRFAAFKDERRLEVYVADGDGRWTFVRSYPILAASGELGPKLREGDRQVPEGIYAIESLNPNSRFHLSLRLGYPNAFDRAKGAADGRDDLGGDIMIHGNRVSIGCIAVGDEAAEDLFVLAADVGWTGNRVVVSPVDFRVRDLPEDFDPGVPWIDELYADVRREVLALPGH